MDPLLSGDVGLAEVLIVLLKVVVVFAFLLVAVMLMIWFERKLISDMQNRIGPDLAGPWGLFQTFADGVKFFFKEDFAYDDAVSALVEPWAAIGFMVELGDQDFIAWLE